MFDHVWLISFSIPSHFAIVCSKLLTQDGCATKKRYDKTIVLTKWRVTMESQRFPIFPKMATKWDDFQSLRCTWRCEQSWNTADLQVFSLKTYQTYQTSSEQPRAKPKKDSPFRITMYSCPGSTEPAIWSASCRMLSEGIARTVPDSSSSAQCLIQDHYCMIKSRCIKWQCLVRPKKFLQNGQVNHDHVRNFKELLQKSMLAATPWCQPLNIQKRDNVVNPIINHPQWHQKWFGRLGIHHQTLGVYWKLLDIPHDDDPFCPHLTNYPKSGMLFVIPIFCVLNPHLQLCFIWVVVYYPIIIHNNP